MANQTGSIPRSFIENLLARADVVQVINQRVPLKKAGATYKACCPFHDEKTPSFNVNPTKQFYHCFGCGASGDALKFMMEYDGLSFVEAVEALAAQYGMEVPREKLSPQQQAVQQVKQQKQRDLYDVMHLAAKFYRHQLRDHPASAEAKSYLKARGLSAEIAKEYVIGFAPPGWDSLVSGLHADAKLKQQLVEVGMLVEKDDGKIYDRFRHRIMFPIRDGRGRVVAFGGRVLGDDQPKYLNSPETPIFHKSYALYGLYEMRQTREKFDHILVVEGYMDVVALAQFGLRNAVATLGTATTADHLAMLFRQVNEVVFCFDGDQAGLKAAWKAMELSLPLMEGERSVKFLFLPEGEDPDSMVRKEGLEAFRTRVGNALSLSDFLLQGLQGKLSFPVNSIEGRQQMVSLATPFVQLAKGLYQYLLVEGLSELVGLPAWRLEKQLNVYSGFAGGKKDNFKPAKVSSAPVSRVVTLPLKLVRILLRRPGWAEFFPENFSKDLLKTNNRDYQVLGGAIKSIVEHSFIAESALHWLAQNGFQSELELIQQSELPDDDQFLRAEFDVAIVALAVALDEEKLGRSGWDLTEMIKLQSLAGEK
ncbi:DNA primase [Thiomicrorhabdus sp. ZW0627]|uniref:DNA primase n=1 Tax=Thiomicrorhabdus sp. ZW0627 TaxID=3039774 RepID=UPI0024364902|nr:DNA primase [Thiomicrorhabdus sp. ZW0627]MDG6773751.1 DNA primase [Thiomicrorhabdus sp. ZW0627]